MKDKMQRVVKSFNLSGLAGVKDVSFGPATPERRRANDYSKEGIPTSDSSSFDDYNERMADFNKRFGSP